MTLVDTDTGEVVSEFTETEARDHTDRINQAVGIAGDLVVEAWNRRIWTTLGYSSWEDYCAAEIRYEATGQSKAVLMVGLRKAGASYRAIGAATGVSHEKARQELAGVNSLTPDAPVTGTDGKTYPSTRPQPEERPADTGDGHPQAEHAPNGDGAPGHVGSDSEASPAVRPPETDAEREARERAEADRRSADRLINVARGWATLTDLAENERRAEILALIDPAYRRVIEEAEEAIHE